MKGCAVSAILQLLLWLSVSAAVMWGVRERCGIPPEESFGPAAFTGLLLSIGIGFFAGIAQTTGVRFSVRCAANGLPTGGASESPAPFTPMPARYSHRRM